MWYGSARYVGAWGELSVVSGPLSVVQNRRRSAPHHSRFTLHGLFFLSLPLGLGMFFDEPACQLSQDQAQSEEDRQRGERRLDGPVKVSAADRPAGQCGRAGNQRQPIGVMDGHDGSPAATERPLVRGSRDPSSGGTSCR